MRILGAERIVRDPENPLDTITLDEVNREFAVNTLSPLFAAKEAVKGFEQLPKSASRTLFFTGNALNVIAVPQVLTFGMAKRIVSSVDQVCKRCVSVERF